MKVVHKEYEVEITENDLIKWLKDNNFKFEKIIHCEAEWDLHTKKENRNIIVILKNKVIK